MLRTGALDVESVMKVPPHPNSHHVPDNRMQPKALDVEFVMQVPHRSNLYDVSDNRPRPKDSIVGFIMQVLPHPNSHDVPDNRRPARGHHGRLQQPEGISQRGYRQPNRAQPWETVATKRGATMGGSSRRRGLDAPSDGLRG